MYPLSTILIGCVEELLPHVRRELMNNDADVEAEFPTVDSAILALRGAPGKRRLLILYLESGREVTNLRRLSSRFAGWPILVFTDNVLGPREGFRDSVFLASMRAGAAQIVPLPLNPADFRAAMDSIAAQFVHSNAAAQVIAVAGATGGCGATTIAVNLAYEIAFLTRRRCILADLSPKIGSVATSLNIVPKYTTLDLLRNTSRLDQDIVKRALVSFTENFSVLAGPHDNIVPTAAPMEHVLQIVELLSQLADVLVLDLDCAYDDLYFEILSRAGQIVLVGEQSIASIRALKMVRETLHRGSVDEFLVINRFDVRRSGFTIVQLMKPLGVERLSTVAADQPAISAAADNGRPLRLHEPGSRALSDIDDLAQLLVPGSVANSTRSNGKGFFGRLRRNLIAT